MFVYQNTMKQVNNHKNNLTLTSMSVILITMILEEKDGLLKNNTLISIIFTKNLILL